MLPVAAFAFAVAAALRVVDAGSVSIVDTWLLPQEKFPFFYRYFPEKVTWNQARRLCNSLNAKLLSLDGDGRRDVLKAYLRELDVLNYVWIGLEKDASHDSFSWINGDLLSGDGYWLEPMPVSDVKLCAAVDPGADLRWIAFRCGGPDIASYLCQLPVPDWARDCVVTELPSLSITLEPEKDVVQLASDCGLAGTRRIVCKGPTNRTDIINHLSCDKDPFPHSSIGESKNQITTTTRIAKKYGTTPSTRKWTTWSLVRQTRHKRSATPATSSNNRHP